ncbi:MAG: hypothetical protein H6563_01525 [Lewinellaceae bacterium]|nr:hypothetical protein [Lewinellaceae bacterium]
MREIILIIHFIGLAMGLGTSLAYMFLGIASSKMAETDALKFQLNLLALSRMGQVGLTLLVVSGLWLMSPHWGLLASSPLLIVKLLLVSVLAVLIFLIHAEGQKAKKGDARIHFQKTAIYGRLALFTALTIVVIAVLFFK